MAVHRLMYRYDSTPKFHTYIVNNRDFIPNSGQRYRRGETISTAFGESTVNFVLRVVYV
jgi:hypothetical protein